MVSEAILERSLNLATFSYVHNVFLYSTLFFVKLARFLRQNHRFSFELIRTISVLEFYAQNNLCITRIGSRNQLHI